MLKTCADCKGEGYVFELGMCFRCKTCKGKGEVEAPEDEETSPEEETKD